jgi:hypothetical protein
LARCGRISEPKKLFVVDIECNKICLSPFLSCSRQPLTAFHHCASHMARSESPPQEAWRRLSWVRVGRPSSFGRSTFLATILVTVFAKTVDRRSDRRPFSRLLLVNAVAIFFCAFLLLTITAFMGLGPQNWTKFLGIDVGPQVTTFSQPGGEVNFGCEAGNTAAVEYRAPPGYRILKRYGRTARPASSQNGHATAPFGRRHGGEGAGGLFWS